MVILYINAGSSIPPPNALNRNVNIETDKVGNIAWDHLMMCITFLILDWRNKKKLKDEFIERYSGDDQLTDTGLESAWFSFMPTSMGN